MTKQWKSSALVICVTMLWCIDIKYNYESFRINLQESFPQVRYHPHLPSQGASRQPQFQRPSHQEKRYLSWRTHAQCRRNLCPAKNNRRWLAPDEDQNSQAETLVVLLPLHVLVRRRDSLHNVQNERGWPGLAVKRGQKEAEDKEGVFWWIMNNDLIFCVQYFRI